MQTRQFQGQTPGSAAPGGPDISILINELAGYGAERMAYNLSAGFKDFGKNVDLVIANNTRGHERKHDPRIHVVAFGKSHIEKCLFDYVRYLNRVKPPLVMATLENSVAIALIGSLFAKHKPKLIVRVANTLTRPRTDPRWLKYVFWRPLAARLYHRADHVITISEGLRQEIITLTGLSPDKVTTVYNPSYPNILTHDKTIRLAGEPAILSVARLDSQKDHPTLIQAFKTVLKTFPNAKLTIIGEGDERARLEDLVNTLGLTGKVFMPGFTANPFAYMQLCDLFVLPSAHEGAGNVLIEALACGAPVVSTDCPHGPKEMLGGGQFGTLVEVGNIEQMAAAMIKILKTGRQALSPALKSYLEQFKAKRVTQRYLEVFAGQ